MNHRWPNGRELAVIVSMVADIGINDHLIVGENINDGFQKTNDRFKKPTSTSCQRRYITVAIIIQQSLEFNSMAAYISLQRLTPTLAHPLHQYQPQMLR